MKCKSCGAEIEFNPKLQKLKCSYCNSEFDPKNYKEDEKKAEEVKELKEEKEKNKKKEQTLSSKTYACKQCGAHLLTFDDTAITFCSYCGSSMIIEAELYKGEAPEYVIPFKLTKDECEKIYKKEIKKFIFAPKEMKEDVVIKKFRGIYMPYAVYKLSHHGPAINKGEKYSHRSGDYVYYDKFDIEANINAEYEGMSYDLSSSFYDRLSEAIAPFDFNEAEPFNVKYLSGYYADSKDIVKDLYVNDAVKLIEPDVSKTLAKNKEFSKYGCSDPTLRFDKEEAKIAYYPVYFLAVRNKKNDAVTYAVVNGQTGKLVVQMPIDPNKYLIFCIILGIAIFCLLNLFLTIKPITLSIFSIILSIINIIIITTQNSKIIKKRKFEDDKGYTNSERKDQTNIPDKKQKTANYVFLILGVVLNIGIIVIKPVKDLYYYSGAIISLVLTLLSFINIVKQYNELSSRKLSQVGIRGGDESEI